MNEVKNIHLVQLDEMMTNRTGTNAMYTKWATNYEKDIAIMNYRGGEIAANCFLKMNVDKEARILDIGAGTGLVGQILHQNGYKFIDALDGNEEMLKILRKKNCYNNIIHSLVTPNNKLPIDDQTYDVVILAGVFCPEHIDYNSFEQIIRLIKSGGIICWSMGKPEIYATRYADQLYMDQNFENYINKLCNESKWIPVPGYPIVVDNYVENYPGFFYAMQII